MSSKFAVIPADALFDKRLTHAQVRCLGFVCYYGAQKVSGCWPSYETIAAQMETDRRNVIRYIKALCDLGYVKKETRRRGDGTQSSNLYRVDYEIEIDERHISSSGKIDHPGSGKIDHPGSGKIDHPNEQENRTVKKNNKKSIKKHLLMWETDIGSKLCIDQMASWVKDNRLDPKKVRQSIIEFRDLVQQNGNEYADFVAAFKNYARRGYLSMKLPQMRLPQEDDKLSGEARIIDRGLSI